MTGIEREITDINEIENILRASRVCRIALIDGAYPYIIPMCFGYSLTGGKLEIYFRCEEKGKKMDLIKANNNAAFEIDKLRDIVKTDPACGFAAQYQSITGTGTIESITGIDKITGLNLLMKKYFGGTPESKYPEQMLNSFAILKLTAGKFCCKEHNPVAAAE
ncbi:MAG: pyridoxamine 5'-phosphate oxidase family protein [Oscillospiraceae bacterium]|nr:pyridoxamine 5'-phosphate oxidase family protein [Oscillospiraceae bacterium]